jgi:hypothetical protein
MEYATDLAERVRGGSRFVQRQMARVFFSGDSQEIAKSRVLFSFSY